MNEGTLKAKWTRHIRKQSFEVKPLSPHQIPGLPDLVVVDKSESEFIRDYHRTSVHWIEAKVFQDRPDCFKAQRDATAKQVEFITTWRIMGVPTWWLILDQSRWMLIPGDQLLLSRTAFKKSARKYGDKVAKLCAPEKNRHVMAAATDAMMDTQRMKIARLFDGK